MVTRFGMKRYFCSGAGESDTLSLVQEYTPVLHQKIAFASTRDGANNDPANNEIYTMNPDGSEVTRLTNNAYYDAAPAWSAGWDEDCF